MVIVDRRVLIVALSATFLIEESGAAKDTGLIFVSNEKSNNVTVLAPMTYKVVKDIKTSRRPCDMHFSADRTKLYVACGDDDVIENHRCRQARSGRQAQHRYEPRNVCNRRKAAAPLRPF